MPVQPRGWKPGIQEAQAICSAVQQSRWPCKESIPESSFAGVAHVCGAPGPGYGTARALATVASMTWRGTAHGVGAGLPLSAPGGGGRGLQAALCSSHFGARHFLTLSPLAALSGAVGQHAGHGDMETQAAPAGWGHPGDTVAHGDSAWGGPAPKLSQKLISAESVLGLFLKLTLV